MNQQKKRDEQRECRGRLPVASIVLALILCISGSAFAQVTSASPEAAVPTAQPSPSSQTTVSTPPPQSAPGESKSSPVSNDKPSTPPTSPTTPTSTSPEEEDLDALAEQMTSMTVSSGEQEEAPATTPDPTKQPSFQDLSAIKASLAQDALKSKPSSSAGNVLQSIYQSMNPDIAMILDVALAGFYGGTPIQVGAHDPNKNGFNLQQLEMSMGASIDPYFRFDTNIVFSLFGVEVEEAYATTLSLPWNLQMRFGQFLTKFGRLNNTHPHSWHFIDQPIVNGKFFGGEGNRGLGTEVSWLAPLPWYFNVIGAATMAVGDCCARSYYGGNNPGVHSPADLLYTGRIEQFFPFNDDLGLLFGINGQTGPNPSGKGNRTNIFATDFYLRWRPSGTTTRTSLDLTVEAMLRNRQIPHRLLTDYGTREELIWRINQQWETGLRHEFVSGVENDPLNPEWTSGRNRYGVQATYYPTHFSRIRLQAGYDDPSYTKPIFTGMLSLEVVAGAHGAHDY